MPSRDVGRKISFYPSSPSVFAAPQQSESRSPSPYSSSSLMKKPISQEGSSGAGGCARERRCRRAGGHTENSDRRREWLRRAQASRILGGLHRNGSNRVSGQRLSKKKVSAILNPLVDGGFVITRIQYETVSVLRPCGPSGSCVTNCVFREGDGREGDKSYARLPGC